jgi:hypothetical protein
MTSPSPPPPSTTTTTTTTTSGGYAVEEGVTPGCYLYNKEGQHRYCLVTNSYAHLDYFMSASGFDRYVRHVFASGLYGDKPDPAFIPRADYEQCDGEWDELNPPPGVSSKEYAAAQDFFPVYYRDFKVEDCVNTDPPALCERSFDMEKGTVFHWYAMKILQGQADVKVLPQHHLEDNMLERHVIQFQTLVTDVPVFQHPPGIEFAVADLKSGTCGCADAIIWDAATNRYVVVDWKNSCRSYFDIFEPNTEVVTDFSQYQFLRPRRGSNVDVRILKSCPTTVKYVIQLANLTRVLEENTRIRNHLPRDEYKKHLYTAKYGVLGFVHDSLVRPRLVIVPFDLEMPYNTRPKGLYLRSDVKRALKRGANLGELSRALQAKGDRKVCDTVDDAVSLAFQVREATLADQNRQFVTDRRIKYVVPNKKQHTSIDEELQKYQEEFAIAQDADNKKSTPETRQALSEAQSNLDKFVAHAHDVADLEAWLKAPPSPDLVLDRTAPLDIPGNMKISELSLDGGGQIQRKTTTKTLPNGQVNKMKTETYDLPDGSHVVDQTMTISNVSASASDPLSPLKLGTEGFDSDRE